MSEDWRQYYRGFHNRAVDSLLTTGEQGEDGYPARLSKRAIRERVVQSGEKSQQTVTNLVGAVWTFERWLWKKDEAREFEKIPAEELDRYLETFFGILKKQNGTDYDLGSFIRFRSYLDRYLKEHGYPHSISKSPAFCRSQAAFRARKHTLPRNVKMGRHMMVSAMSNLARLETDAPFQPVFSQSIGTE